MGGNASPVKAHVMVIVNAILCFIIPNKKHAKIAIPPNIQPPMTGATIMKNTSEKTVTLRPFAIFAWLSIDNLVASESDLTMDNSGSVIRNIMVMTLSGRFVGSITGCAFL